MAANLFWYIQETSTNHPPTAVRTLYSHPLTVTLMENLP